MERNVFKYHDGKSDRAADPIAVYRAIYSHPSCNVDRACQVLQEAKELLDQGGEAAKAIDQGEYWDAYGQVVRATAGALGVTSWSEQTPDGLTEEQIMSLYHQFAEFSESQKKTPAPLPILPPVTEPEPSPA